MIRLPAWSAVALAFIAATVVTSSALALEECRLLRQPDIQGDRIVFVYAGDLWTVARAGGVATRLTSHAGAETFPKLSPDGKTVAFTGEYDGNVDAYTVPVAGGEPARLTWHPGGDQVAEWYPDGASILIRSARASAMQRYSRFFKVPAGGGFEEMLPLPTAGYATLSADGRQIAYVAPAYDNRTWKRYRGGNAANIWRYDFDKVTSEKITDTPGPDEWPMWYQNTIYYVSDRGGRTANVWVYDLGRKTHRQVTHFTEYDVKWASIGGDAMVFENGGQIHVMDLPGEKGAPISVLVPSDKPAARAELRDVGKWIDGFDLSPSAKRAVVAARGDLITIPAKDGDARNLTNTPGARERDPVWSPDGKWIACLSDRSGEYQLHVIGSDGKTTDRQITTEGATFRFAPVWSPDSKKLAFSDKTFRLWWADVATGKLTQADKSEYGEIHAYQWSPDSKWITYPKAFPNRFARVMLYSLDSGKATSVTDAMSDAGWPTFDPEGKYLYFVSSRTFDPQFGAFELDFQFRDTDKIYALSLNDSTPSPVAPKSDEESAEGADKAAGGKDGDKGGDKAGAKTAGKGAEAKPEVVAPVRIDLAGLGQRCAVLPVPAGRYAGLQAFKGKLLYLSLDPPDPEADGPGGGTLHLFDLEKRKDKTVIAGVRGAAASKDGGKVLVHVGEGYAIVDADEGQKIGDNKIKTDGLMTLVDPHREWMQMFNEAWRLERDFYYDPGMGGLDWKAVGERYRTLVPFVAHRADLNYLLGELIGELSTSHSYVGGGEMPEVARVATGLLGADYALDAASGRYRFATIYRERDWNTKVAAPLGEPGIGVKEGDYLLAVDGRPLRAPENVYAAFAGTTGKQTVLTVGTSADDPKPRTVTVVPIASEASLRYVAWVAANRAKVDAATGGRIAYIHVPNTAIAGIQEFTRQYFPQTDKQGIIVDERFNGGGFIPDFFVERLSRKTWVEWTTRDGASERTPSSAIDGPKCILANEYAGSGGDAFPFYFKMQGLGPIIGKRTWGGLVGISHSLPFVDGGSVTMPDFGMYDPRTGQWLVENHGVDPDIEVENAPDLMVKGHDPQLEKAIEWSLEQLKTNPPPVSKRPPYKVQEGLSK